MGRLSQFFRLSARHEELETKLLNHEYRSLLMDDHDDDSGETELRARLFEVSEELSSLGHRHRER